MAQGIALTFPTDIATTLVELQNRLALTYELSPIQKLGEYVPHITVIQAAEGVSLDDELAIEAFAMDIRRPAYSIGMRLGSVYYTPVGWYFLAVEKTEWMNILHEAVFARFKDELRKGKIDRTKSIDDYSGEEKENYLRYGYRYIGAAWSPHVTVGRTSNGSRLPDDKGLVAAYEQSVSGKLVKPSALSVYEIGYNGGYAKALFSRELQR